MKVRARKKRGCSPRQMLRRALSNPESKPWSVSTVTTGPEAVLASGGVARRAGHAVLLCPRLPQGGGGLCGSGWRRGGIQAIDAPMSGGPARAGRHLQHGLMVACDDAKCSRSTAGCWKRCQTKLFRISGRPGDGARTWACQQTFGRHRLVAAEALALAARLGAGRRAHSGRDRAVQWPELD